MSDEGVRFVYDEIRKNHGRATWPSYNRRSSVAIKVSSPPWTRIAGEGGHLPLQSPTCLKKSINRRLDCPVQEWIVQKRTRHNAQHPKILPLGLHSSRPKPQLTRRSDQVASAKSGGQSWLKWRAKTMRSAPGVVPGQNVSANV
jgi:hypothetical protein